MNFVGRTPLTALNFSQIPHCEKPEPAKRIVFEVDPLISEDFEVLSVGKALKVFEMDFRTDPRWERFVSTHSGASIYHHPGWLSALESEYQQKCVSLACVDKQGQVCALLPLFYTKGLSLNLGPLSTGRRLSSLPRTPMSGPLATSPEAAAAIVEYAVRLARVSTRRATGDQNHDCRPG